MVFLVLGSESVAYLISKYGEKLLSDLSNKSFDFINGTLI